MSKRGNDKEFMIYLTPKPNQSFFCLPDTKQRKKNSRKRDCWGKEGVEKPKGGFLTALITAIPKDPITPIRKHTNELKVHEKSVRTAIKQDLSTELNPLDYVLWGILENKTNATSPSNINSLKTGIEQEWNKMSEEFILKACKSFQCHVDTIIEKKKKK